MNVKYNLKGKERKALAEAVGEILGASYCFGMCIFALFNTNRKQICASISYTSRQ